MIKCSTPMCPLVDECYRKMAIEDPIDQEYKDYRGSDRQCSYFIKNEVPVGRKK